MQSMWCFAQTEERGLLRFLLLWHNPLPVYSARRRAGIYGVLNYIKGVIMNEIVKDPVCHMQVASTSFATEYAGSHYAFCSAQCKERFLANPHLYIGFPGRPAPAQEGREVIKRHRLLLSAPLDAMQAEQVKRALFELMGIHEVSIDGDKIEIHYGLIKVTVEQIADKLA